MVAGACAGVSTLGSCSGRPTLFQRGMKILWEAIIRGYLRIIEPVADFFVRKRVHPNTITTIGTLCSITGGVIYATGHIMTAGWVIGLVWALLCWLVARYLQRRGAIEQQGQPLPPDPGEHDHGTPRPGHTPDSFLRPPPHPPWSAFGAAREWLSTLRFAVPT